MTPMPAHSAHHPPSISSLRSALDFDNTVQQISLALSSRGMTIFADIDQRQAAVSAQTDLRPTRLILFGNPAAGTPIMQANPHAAVELPLKVVVWSTQEGEVFVDYLNPAEILVQAYGIDHALTDAFGRIPALLAQAIAAMPA